MVCMLLATQCKISGLSPLFNLSMLYQQPFGETGLDLVNDVLFDAMHTFFCHGNLNQLVFANV
jgi:hypothetical protein